LIAWRFVTGLGALGASGIVPLALALMGGLFLYEQRGRPLGWLFGAMAGGMAFGSTVGVILEPFVGWRMLFIAVALAGGLILCLLLPYGSLLDGAPTRSRLSVAEMLAGYRSLLACPSNRTECHNREVFLLPGPITLSQRDRWHIFAANPTVTACST